ncbi:MAG: ribonuclease HII [Thermodesulfobacteriota bacterium]
MKDLPDYYENRLDQISSALIAGVDEVGRGPLAGPVVAAAVVFPRGVFVSGVTDSKKLSAGKREKLFPLIKEKALALGLGLLWPKEIDQLNILRASLRAMERAVGNLGLRPDLLLIDGNQPLNRQGDQRCLVQGDRISHSIGAASIMAKVVRDKLMESWHYRFPQYNFLANKGYGTREHLEALRLYGPCPLHRLSFRGTLSNGHPKAH